MEAFDALLDSAQQGDMAAYGRIVRRFQNMALGYAYAILGDVHLAEDAVQDAFVETCLNLSRVYGPKAFPAFLRKVIFKHCDRAMRKRRPEVTLEDAPALPSPDTPEQDLERCETTRRIHRVFVRGIEPVSADAFADQIRNVLNVNIPIRITLARSISS